MTQDDKALLRRDRAPDERRRRLRTGVRRAVDTLFRLRDLDRLSRAARRDRRLGLD